MGMRTVVVEEERVCDETLFSRDEILWKYVENEGTPEWILAATVRVVADASLESGYAECEVILSDSPDKSATPMQLHPINTVRREVAVAIDLNGPVNALCVRVRCKDRSLKVHPSVLCNKTVGILPMMQTAYVGDFTVGRGSYIEGAEIPFTLASLAIMLLFFLACAAKRPLFRASKATTTNTTNNSSAATACDDKEEQELLRRIGVPRAPEENAEIPNVDADKEWSALFASVYSS